ncbi:hypothetical protein [Saccharothrix syringae]|uniref:Uncharacterized protein n=1 Tax=Saccharothrix syringae TaxID=103733 RepID=A0A5Q0GX91_SACSY|nr:hypothetical protein [Saccharothrix syringae]QFZ18578.1 hypothetical protein EKG83_14905 [Saccharothrix syringae]
MPKTSHIDYDRVEDANQFGSAQDPDNSEHNLTTGPDKVDYLTSPDVESSIPPPPRHGGTGGGKTSVSTEALKTVATNLRTLQELLREARHKLAHVTIAPGLFYDAERLIGDLPKLVNPTSDFLGQADEALELVSRNLERLAHSYETTEELNKIDAGKLGEGIKDTIASIREATGADGSTLFNPDNPLDIKVDGKDGGDTASGKGDEGGEPEDQKD